MKKSLTRQERLNRKTQFDCVFDSPDFRQSCHGASLVIRRNNLSYNRFAVLAVKKFGKAVQRNYSRRVLKEIYRQHKQLFPTGVDIIAVIYPGIFNYHDREQQFLQMIRRINFDTKTS